MLLTDITISQSVRHWLCEKFLVNNTLQVVYIVLIIIFFLYHPRHSLNVRINPCNAKSTNISTSVTGSKLRCASLEVFSKNKQRRFKEVTTCDPLRSIRCEGLATARWTIRLTTHFRVVNNNMHKWVPTTCMSGYQRHAWVGTNDTAYAYASIIYRN